MTETVVTNSSVSSIVTPQQTSTVVSQVIGTQTIVAGLMGLPGSVGNKTVSELADVDISQLTDGAVLVYRADTSVWQATNKLDSQIFEAGQF